jgi:membrane protease YdiL (CAAX protease family)
MVMNDLLFKNLENESREPKPLGILGVVLFTIGLVVFQFTLFAMVYFIFGWIGKDHVSSMLMIIVLILGSTVWLAAALFLQKVLHLPSYFLNVTFKGLTTKTVLLLIVLVPLIQFTGGYIDILLLRIFPSSTQGGTKTLELFNNLILNLPISLIFVLFITVIVAPFVEEYYFRGILLRGLKLKGYGFLVAGILTSFIFSIVHGHFIGFFILFTVGLSCAYLSFKTKTLLPSMLLHGFYNSVVMSISLSTFYLTKPEFKQFSMGYDNSSTPPDIGPLAANILIPLVTGTGAVLLIRYIASEIGKQSPYPTHEEPSGDVTESL